MKSSDSERPRNRYASVLAAAAVVAFLCASAAFAVRPVSADDERDNERVYPSYNPKPKGIPPVPIPEDNPQTPAKVKLGEKLYFDPMLSVDGTISCASCHHPSFGFADGEEVSDGVGGQKGGRNAPTVYNAAYCKTQFWDGRALTLEDQARGPPENPIEMANTWENIVDYLKSESSYRRMFKQAFGGTITEDTAVMAIASYERTVITWDSPYDRYIAGDVTAMTSDQIAGVELFNGKANCGGCHAAPLFFEDLPGNIGVPQERDYVNFPNSDESVELQGYDLGVYYVFGDTADLGRFKTPGLRNIELTAPYMHNGIFETLDEVIAHYNEVPIPVVGELEEDLIPNLELTDMEQQQLVEFLKALTGITYSYMPDDEMSDMFVMMLSGMIVRPLD
ncbi:MAG TPA: cytochrome c peroxidase [Thermoplasmata archaeon]